MPATRTIVYVDGYNLYYGRLRGTPFKWLDLVKLFHNILIARSQSETLEKVKVFSAPALARFATHGQASVEAQSAYHRALRARYGGQVEVIYGSHSFDRNGALLPEFVEGQPYERARRVRVWKLEEKKTDVNLALQIYRDVNSGRCERIILASNDSDAAPALEAIRQDFPQVMIGVVMPIRPSMPEALTKRRISGSLAEFADWVIANIDDVALMNAQLPEIVPTEKKPIVKPSHW